MTATLKIWLIAAASGGAAFFVASAAVAGPDAEAAVTWIQVVQSGALAAIALSGAWVAWRLNTGRMLRDTVADLQSALRDRDSRISTLEAEVDMLKKRTDIDAVLKVVQQHADDSSRTLEKVSRLLDRISKRLDVQPQEAN